jgi:hypothetical protein
MLRKRIKPAYLLFLVLPLLFYFLWQNPAVQELTKSDDYFYFSVHTSRPAVISLYSGEDSLTSWTVDSKGYKFLGYVGTLKDTSSIVLKIHQLGSEDTLSFLGFNRYHDQQLQSLYKQGEPWCSLQNATSIDHDGLKMVVVKNTGLPVSLSLKAPVTWEQPRINLWFTLLIALCFAGVFILILVWAPPVRYFMISCVLAALLMFLFYWVEKDYACEVTLSTTTQVKRFETFYNSNPCFVAEKTFSSDVPAPQFMVPVDLRRDPYIRCDMDESPDILDQLNLNISAGFFCTGWNLNDVPREKMLINDLTFVNGKFRVCGTDPYIAFSSTIFTHRIQWLLLLRQAFFLFITLMLFVVLIGIHRWLASRLTKRSNPVYAMFLLFPMGYFIFTSLSNPTKPVDDTCALFFSMRTTKPSSVDLLNGDQRIVSWNVGSPGYQYLQYKGDLSKYSGIKIQVRGLAASDSLSLLAVNLYSDGRVVTDDKPSSRWRRTSNAGIIAGDGVLDAVVKKSEVPVIIELPPFFLWQQSTNVQDLNILIYLLFVVAFIWVLIVAPSTKHFLIAAAAALFLMGLLFGLLRDKGAEVAMESGVPMKSADFFYHKNPCFNATEKVSRYQWSGFFQTYLNLTENRYLRCDVNEQTKVLRGFKVSTKKWVLRKEFDFSGIPLKKMVVNDMLYRNGSFIVRGKDPYFCLTSNYFSNRISSLILLYERLFLFAGMLVFLTLIPLLSLIKRSTFGVRN